MHSHFSTCTVMQSTRSCYYMGTTWVCQMISNVVLALGDSLALGG